MTQPLLVIDDSEDICKILKEWLNVKGYDVTYATSAKEGLDLFTKGKFSVVMLDIRMPDSDGITVLKKIKEINVNTAVIIMTGFPSDQTISEALSLGAYDYLVKPFQVEKIVFLVERAFSFYAFKSMTKKPSTHQEP
jgi:two-component system response regulator HydG